MEQSKLDALQPKEVFHFFKEICEIPHGSYNTKQISDYLVAFAKDRNLEVHQDEVNNVVIIKEATEDQKDKEPIIIQGHMDMVAVKTDTCTKNMETEGLDLDVEGDYIFAKETSLGGDDGIAVAYALAILDSKEISHPRLEVVLTVDEETGMEGAAAVDLSYLQAKKLLNIDSEKEGELTVACAGGECMEGVFDITWTAMEEGAKLYELSLAGLAGGHSGMEIIRHGANAGKLMAQVIYLLRREMDIALVSLDGGNKDNVIPSGAKAVIACTCEKEQLVDIIEIVEETLQDEWKKQTHL